MGLLRKKRKVENKEEVQNSTAQEAASDVKESNNVEKLNVESDVEILELDDEKKPIENTLETRKENRIMLVILIGIIAFALFLPSIADLFSKNEPLTNEPEIKDIESSDTIDGMLAIGKEKGYIIAKKIKFYNFLKKGENKINVVYLPESTIKDVNEKNIYIEFYNSGKKLINRVKFESDEKLGRKVQGTYSIEVNESIYAEAKYGKIVIIEDESWGLADSFLQCSKLFKDGDFNVEYRNTYHFSSDGLIDYYVGKRAYVGDEFIKECIGEDCPENNNNNEENQVADDKYKKAFKKEGEELAKTNASELYYDYQSISYLIDLKEYDPGTSDYKLLYKLGSVSKQVKLTEEANGWTCVDE